MNTPVIGTPFDRVAIDIVGPLATRSRRGNKFILVLCDYATGYPEAVAISSIEASRIAEELLAIFSRVGFPCELLSDQSSNFESELFSKVCQLMGIKKIRTSPYHSQTNEMVERFNGALKSLLKRSTKVDPKTGTNCYHTYSSSTDRYHKHPLVSHRSSLSMPDM